MGQKVNPHGFRVGVIKNWDSRWFVKDEAFGDTLVSDYKIRKYLKGELQGAGVPKIEIERDSHRVRVFIHCAKPVPTACGTPAMPLRRRRLPPANAISPPSPSFRAVPVPASV